MSLSIKDRANPIETRILDAAYKQVMAVGFRRTTLTDVAERAGLSRMTAYRRYRDVASILQALMSREFGAILERGEQDTADVVGSRERIVSYAVRVLDLLSSHELFLRLLDVDPELLLPYMTSRLGRVPAAFVTRLSEQLEVAMEEGAVRRDDPERLARSMQMAMRGFAYSARDGTRQNQRQHMLADLAIMLDGLLRADAP
jgi:AcrR family transcriptional regulator